MRVQFCSIVSQLKSAVEKEESGFSLSCVLVSPASPLLNPLCESVQSDQLAVQVET